MLKLVASNAVAILQACTLINMQTEQLVAGSLQRCGCLQFGLQPPKLHATKTLQLIQRLPLLLAGLHIKHMQTCR
jgi:hypothetical protein